MNLQIRVASIAPLFDTIIAHNIPLFLPLKEKCYQRGNDEIGQRQFIVADPDGYLLRFYEQIGAIKKNS